MNFFNFGGGGMPHGMHGGRGGGAPQKAAVDNNKYYEILGVSKEATADEIKKAFRRQAMVHHPDKGGDPDKFRDLQSAYEVLSNEEKKALYDEGGEEAVENGHAGGAGGMGDIFDLFGGGGRRRGPPPKQRGEDVLFPLSLSLEEMFSGCTKKLRLTRSALCTGCKGAGGSSVVTCTGCKGAGQRMVTRSIGPGMITQQTVICPSCKGEGKTVPPAAKCKPCDGVGTVKEQKTVEVPVPRGCVSGSTHIFPGGADEAPNTVTGDIVVQFQAKDHSVFKRQADHLFAKLDISLLEALVGFKKYLPTLDGKSLEIEHKGVITPGSSKRIADAGMPMSHTRGIDSGNLYVEFNVVFPKDGSITADQAEMLKKALPQSKAEATPKNEIESVLLENVNMDVEKRKIAKEEEEQIRRVKKAQRSSMHDDDDEEYHHGHGQPACQQA